MARCNTAPFAVDWRDEKRIHCHSDPSDGQRSPEAVVGAYRDAGYVFHCLSDHFEAEYGWWTTDTRPMRNVNFTTIVGAELSSAPCGDRFRVTAAGLPSAPSAA